MAVPLFNETGNLTLIDLADTGTNWLPADVDIDIKVEGVGAGFDAIRNGGTVTYSFPAAVDMSAAGTHVRVWFQHTFPSYLETKALGGIQLVVSTGNSDNIYYVSGSDQQELREIFKKRRISTLFDSGVFGSPDTKDFILERETASGNIVKPALFIGDSITDYKASQKADMSFVFLTKWSGVANWSDFLNDEELVLDSLDDLLNFLD